MTKETTANDVAKDCKSNVLMIDIARLEESKRNVRKRKDKPALESLVESIKENGVLQPLVGIGDATRGQIEILIGNRRLCAARKVGLKVLPVEVRASIEDDRFTSIALVENLQREDLDPIDEAQGYKELVDRHKLAPEQIAARVGRSSSYVYRRLRLAELHEEVIRAVRAGAITFEIAGLIARIPVKSAQQEALGAIRKEATRFDPNGSATIHDAKTIIQHRFMFRLADAPFDREDATLCPKAGACSACPKRTGSCPSLFDDVKEADTCTDPTCYGDKVKAMLDARIKAAKERKEEILEGEAADRAFPFGPTGAPRGFIRLDDRCDLDERKRSYRQVLKPAPPPTTLAVFKREGLTVEIAAEKAVAAALKKIGLIGRFDPNDKAPKPSEADRTPAEAPAKDAGANDRQAAKIEAATQNATIAEIVRKGETVELDRAALHLIAVGLIDSAWNDTLRRVEKRRDQKSTDGKPHGTQLRKIVADAPAKVLKGLIFELIAVRDLSNGADGRNDLIGTATKILGINTRKIQADAADAVMKPKERKAKTAKADGGKSVKKSAKKDLKKVNK